jgi:membrane-bound lytic murein transglycosylase MltF
MDRRYLQNANYVKNAGAEAERRKLRELVKLFETYGKRYDIDYLLMAAQGYQESRLDQNAKSHVGAVGVMQLMPATGKELKVGDISKIEPNIHAGTKYMDKLMTDYFKDAKFDETNRTLFAFAAYNAGPGRISQMRKEAVKRGLNPDKWFNNVEVVTAQRVGIETTTYVRNIYKYYVAYKLTIEARDAQEAARKKVAGST